MLKCGPLEFLRTVTEGGLKTSSRIYVVPLGETFRYEEVRIGNDKTIRSGRDRGSSTVGDGERTS